MTMMDEVSGDIRTDLLQVSDIRVSARTFSRALKQVSQMADGNKPVVTITRHAAVVGYDADVPSPGSCYRHY